MEKRTVGGGLLTASGVLGPPIATMMGLTIPAPWGWILLGACGLMTAVGLWLVLGPSLRKKPEPEPERNSEPAKPEAISADLTLENDFAPVIKGNDFSSNRSVGISLKGTRGAVIDGNVFGPLEDREPPKAEPSTTFKVRNGGKLDVEDVNSTAHNLLDAEKAESLRFRKTTHTPGTARDRDRR